MWGQKPTAGQTVLPVSGEQDPEGILRRAYPILTATAARLVLPSQVDDLVQDAIVETLSRHPDFRGIDHPVGYMRTVLFRAASRRWRRARMEEVPTDVQDLLDVPSEWAADHHLLAQSVAASLPLRQRSCVVLRYVFGFDDETISAVLGCKESTVRSQIARGLAALRKELPDEPP